MLYQGVLKGFPLLTPIPPKKTKTKQCNLTAPGKIKDKTSAIALAAPVSPSRPLKMLCGSVSIALGQKAVTFPPVLDNSGCVGTWQVLLPACVESWMEESSALCLAELGKANRFKSRWESLSKSQFWGRFWGSPFWASLSTKYLEYWSGIRFLLLYSTREFRSSLEQRQFVNSGKRRKQGKPGPEWGKNQALSVPAIPNHPAPVSSQALVNLAVTLPYVSMQGQSSPCSLFPKPSWNFLAIVQSMSNIQRALQHVPTDTAPW